MSRFGASIGYRSPAEREAAAVNDAVRRAETGMRWAKWRREHGTALGLGGVAVVVLGTAWLLSTATKSEAAPPAPSSSPPAAVGARFTVHTPRGEPGRLRASAGLTSPVVALIPRGTEVSVLDVAMVGDHRWYQIPHPEGRRVDALRHSHGANMMAAVLAYLCIASCWAVYFFRRGERLARFRQIITEAVDWIPGSAGAMTKPMRGSCGPARSSLRRGS